MRVFVLDKRSKPLMPCHPARARELLKEGHAVVHRVMPFTIRLKDRVGGDVQPVRLKLDPGSKVTGVALVREAEVVAPATGELQRQAHVLMLAELQHRGHQIREALTQRLRERIRNEMEKNRRLQISPRAERLQLGSDTYLTSPKLKEYAGAFLEGPFLPYARIDYTGHCLSTMVKLERYRLSQAK